MDMVMSKDIVIYEKETKKILAIITNKDLIDSKIVVNKQYNVIEVDNTKKYIIGNELIGEIKFQNPESNILYFKDFI